MPQASADDEVGSPESDSLLKYVPNAAPVGTAWRQASSSRQLSKGSSVEEVAFLEEINPEHVEDDAVLSEKTSPSGRADARAEPEIPTQVGFRHLGCFTCDANHSEASELKASRPQSEAPEMFRGHVPGALCNMVEPHSPRQLAAWKQQEQRNRQFQINISKKGKKLGLRYDDSDGLALVIKIIDPGVLYDSIMEMSSDQWAMPEDRIIEVNGVRGKSEWLEEQCMKSDVLTLTLERVLPAPNERIFGQSEDPTVIVHAYDLFGHGKGPMACMSRTLNSMSTRFGLFHTGVEVFGREWFFGASLEGLFHGVNCTEPKQHPVHRYRTSVALGTCKITAEAFEELMPLIRMKWPAWSYHAISRNCHSFTDFFCKILGFESAPRFRLFGSGDAMLVPGAAADARSLAPCGSCASLKTGEGRQMPMSPSSEGSCIRVEA